MRLKTPPSNESYRIRHRALGGLAVAGAAFVSLLLGGCELNPVGSGAGKQLFTMSLVEVSGNDQILAPGGVQSAPLVVRVVDQNGSPHRGMVINWTLTRGTGTLSATSSTSDSEGLVRVTYTSGAETGETLVTASFNPLASGASASRDVNPVSFTVTVTGP